MKFIALQKFVRQSPRKIRMVANQVKDLPLETAIRQLAVIEQKSTSVLLKVVKQAIANAQNNHGVTFDNLEIAQVMIGEGPRYKRFRAASRGRAHSIIKRTSHVQVVLQTKEGVSAPKVKPVAKVAKPTKADDQKKETKKDTNVQNLAKQAQAPVKSVRGTTQAKRSINRVSTKKAA